MVGNSDIGASFIFFQIGDFSIRLRRELVRCAGRQLSSCSRHAAQRPSRLSHSSLPLIRFIGLALAAVTSVFGAAAQAEDLNIYFKTSPATERLRPYADPATLSLLITGADGRPVTQGTVAIRLDAPRPGRFFSTDFPWVEGTRLHEMRIYLRQGRANWKYLFPLRGEYRLAVDVTAADGKKASKNFAFTVRENEMKWATLAAFSAALFFLGVIAGRIFTRLQTVTTVLAAALLVAPAAFAASETSQGGDLAALEIEAATVGRPTVVRWYLKNSAADESSHALLSLAIVHIEKGKIAFEVERIPVAGEFTMNFQFTDGAEYRIAAVAERPGQRPLRSEKIISVTALEPPMKTMVPPLAYFVGMIALGLGTGRWSKRRAATA
jgi:hypothetical protein